MKLKSTWRPNLKSTWRPNKTDTAGIEMNLK